MEKYKIWKRFVEKYKIYGTLSKTIHCLNALCEARMVQECTEAQTGVVQDGLSDELRQLCYKSQGKGQYGLPLQFQVMNCVRLLYRQRQEPSGLRLSG